MYKTTKLIVALGAAGVVAAAGSAFTAGSTIDEEGINVGSVSQTVSGANITNVVHAYTAVGDITTSITAKAEELLSDTPGVVKISVNDAALEICTVVVTDVAPLDTDEGAGDYSTITCDIADTANLTSIRFVVNG